MKLILVAMCSLLIAACSEGKYAGLTSEELKNKKHHCDSIPQKSAVFANGCDQITKEVKRRKDAREK